MTGPRRLRPAARAVVVHDQRILVTRNRTSGDTRPDWYVLPGGGQHPGETLTATLVREVREETGVEVRPGALLWLRELIPGVRGDAPLGLDPDEHLLECVFDAEFVVDHGDAHEADPYQQGIAWVTPDYLSRIRFYPSALVPALLSHLSGTPAGAVYLGDVD